MRSDNFPPQGQKAQPPAPHSEALPGLRNLPGLRAVLPGLRGLRAALLILIPLSLTLLPLLGVRPCRAAMNPPTMVLQMAIPYNDQHPVQQTVFLPWAKAMGDQSKGLFNIDVFDAKSQLREGSPLAALISGTLSLGGILPSAILPNPPVSCLLNCYLEAPNAREASRQLWQVFQKHEALKNEWHLVHVLWVWTSAPVYIHTQHRPIHSLQDLQGMKILVWSEIMFQLIHELGGIPILCLPAETETLLLQGIAEGVLSPLPPLKSFNLDKQIRFSMDIPLEYLGFYMSVNKEIWTALPPESKKHLTESSGLEMSLRCGEALDAVANYTRKRLLQQGHIFTPVSPQDRQTIQQYMDTIRRRQAAKIESLHIPGMTDFAPLIRETQEQAPISNHAPLLED